MIVTQYLHQMGAHSDLKAALVISCVWDVFKSKVSLEDNPINFNLYTRNLCKSLKSLVERYASLLAPPCDLHTHLVPPTLACAAL